jgi:membrane protein
MRSLINLLGQTYERWSDDRTIRLGAGVAYYGLFAVVPLVTLSIALAQVVFSESEIQSFLENTLTSLFGSDAAQATDGIVEKLESTGTTTGLGLFGILSLIAATSILFVALQDALNVIWGVPPTRGIGHVVRRYGLAYLVVLLAGSLLLAALAVQAIDGLAEKLIPGEWTVIEDVAGLISIVGSWGLGIGLLAVLFRVLPQASVTWRVALIGAAVAAACLAVTTWALGVYIQRVGSVSLAGAASTLVLVTVWIYANAQIVLAGAVMTRVLTDESAPDDAPPG